MADAKRHARVTIWNDFIFQCGNDGTEEVAFGDDDVEVSCTQALLFKQLKRTKL
jgi:hypothetical protein